MRDCAWACVAVIDAYTLVQAYKNFPTNPECGEPIDAPIRPEHI